MNFVKQIAAERRAQDRKIITLQAKARKPSGHFAAVTITDISMDGFATLGFEPYAPGTEILIYLPGLAPKTAQVVWQKDGKTGSEFLEPLHPAVVEHLSRQFG